MERQAFSLVLIPPFQPSIEWQNLQMHHSVITMTSHALLVAAADTAVQNGVEVERVIFDQSATSDDFLKFLTLVSPAHRSDILLIKPDGSGFLSAVMRHDGRSLYHLEPADVSFYLATHFSEMPMRMAS